LSGPALTEIRQADEAFDQRWRFASESVIATIEETLPDLVTSQPNLIRVRGGLVFSNSKARIDIPPGCPFNWGVIPFWLNKLEEVPPVAGFDESTIVQLIDVLITRHQQVAEELPQRSMLELAEGLLVEGNERLKVYAESINKKEPVVN
jgi:hypothetical protein